MSLAAWLRAVVFFGGVFVATSTWALDRSGNWWLAQTNSDRLIYVIGFFDGMEFELDRARLELTNILQVSSYPQPCDDSCVKTRLDQAITNWGNLLRAHRDFDNVTAGQLVAGVDAMCADYRNRTIAITDILSVVVWSIKGIDQKVIDGRLTYLRTQK